MEDLLWMLVVAVGALAVGGLLLCGSLVVLKQRRSRWLHRPRSHNQIDGRGR